MADGAVAPSPLTPAPAFDPRLLQGGPGAFGYCSDFSACSTTAQVATCATADPMCAGCTGAVGTLSEYTCADSINFWEIPGNPAVPANFGTDGCEGIRGGLVAAGCCN